MKTSFGDRYLETSQARVQLGDPYTVRRVRSGWLVVKIRSGKMFEVFPTKLRAYYAASRLNGWIDEVFHFGTDMFNKS